MLPGPSRTPPAVLALVLVLVLAVGLAASSVGCSDPEAPAEGGTSATSGDASVPSDDAGIVFPSAEAGRDAGPIDWTVNGHPLTAEEQAAMLVIAGDVVPKLAGTRAERVTVGAQGAWWALKEGTWEQPLAAVYAYSNCNTSSGDKTIGPTQVCGSGRAWQVGLAAVQVPNHTLAEVEALAARIFPGTTSNALLAAVAAKAGVSKATSDAIVASTGSLRTSWLLRVPAVGLAAVVPDEVVPECIEASKSWCFGSAWDETKKFAPTKAAATIAIADLTRILAALAP